MPGSPATPQRGARVPVTLMITDAQIVQRRGLGRRLDPLGDQQRVEFGAHADHGAHDGAPPGIGVDVADQFHVQLYLVGAKRTKRSSPEWPAPKSSIATEKPICL